jgi:hypothetical protein
MISPNISRLVVCLFAFWLADIAYAADPILPNLHLTPGVYRKDLTAAKICKTKWGLDKRHVTESMKKQVFAEYRIDLSRRSEFEVDHLVSRELGGADDVKNLWPESYITQPYNAHRKDRLENHLHKLICNKTITLEQARDAVTHDWRKAYKKYFGVPTPEPVKAANKKR